MNKPNVSRTLTPAPGARLAQLALHYADAKAEYDAAKERLDSLKAEIKTEMTAAAPGIEKVDLEGPVPLWLRYKTTWRLDSKQLKLDHPRIWVAYATQSGSWDLRPATS